MSVLDTLRGRLARWVAPAAPAAAAPAPVVQPADAPARRQVRMYAGAAVDRTSSDWNPINTSADAELVMGTRMLRARSRELIRNNDYAKNAVRIIATNVVGTGIRMQPVIKTAGGKLVSRINAQISDAWDHWSDAENCHVAGKMSMPAIELLLMKRVVTDGEVLVRKVKQKFGRSKVTLALEIIEADRLVDNWTSTLAPNGNTIRMGVEVDQWLRPVAYWLYPNHPGDFQFAHFEAERFLRVPADEIIHLYTVDRWPQTRGEPWFHTAMRRLHNLGGTEEGEIVKLRAQAAIMGFITSPEIPEPDDVVNGQRVTDMQPGQIEHLQPGEAFQGFDPSSPNPGLESFLRYMVRGAAAGLGVSYEAMSRDYSQSNYSSSRLALLDDRDNWRVLQGWLIGQFRMNLHRTWLEQAVMAGAVQIPDFYQREDAYLEAVVFKPRGWGWIDPTKEVAAYRAAVRAGFMTVSEVIELTGNGADAEETFKARREELDLMGDLELVFDTDVAQVDDKGAIQAMSAPQEDPDGGEASAPAAPAPADAPEPADAQADNAPTEPEDNTDAAEAA